MKEGVCNGEYQLVYFTPEILLGGKKWTKLLVGDVYSSQARSQGGFGGFERTPLLNPPSAEIQSMQPAKATQTKFIVSQARPHDKIASWLLFFYHVMTRDHRFFMVDSCIFQC